MLESLFFSTALSIDGFIVGTAFGARNVSIGLGSRMLIAGCSAASILTSAFVGRVLARVFDPLVATIIGAFLLVALGVWTAANSRYKEPPICSVAIVSMKVPNLGLVVQILRDPIRADSDRSGGIDAAEAFVLGVALAADAFGLGLGLGMTGSDGLLLSLSTGIGMFCFMGLGLAVGRAAVVPGLPVVLAPGVVIAALGLFRAVHAVITR